jgi:hypothetical protein
MADAINENGLTVKTLTEIETDLKAGLRDIYGDDINLEQNSPDGQMVGIIAQAATDLRELLVNINNSFDPDFAVGRLLDERVVINNIQRRGGTFTTVEIEIVVDRTVTLVGLDGDYNNLDGTGYTVQDDAGNQFILVDTTEITAGTHTKNFRAKQIGKVEVTENTITTPTTSVLGVVSVNNPSGALEIGQNEETDAELRVRRQQSVALGSVGYLNGILGAVLALDGVTDAKIYENVENAEDDDDIPAHGIWLIVEGGANTDIGNVIYEKKSYGANMKGEVEVEIETASGATFTALFDRPSAKNLHIRFEIKPTQVGATFDQAAIKQYIVDNLSYNIGDFATTGNITTLAQTAITTTGGRGVPINMEVSADGSSWVDFLEVDTLDEQWVVATSRITITEV